MKKTATKKGLVGAFLGVVLWANSLCQGLDTPMVDLWSKFEAQFQSLRDYENPLYDVARFTVHFRSSSGRVTTINGFWDGRRTWKVRFQPNETGVWTYRSECSVQADTGLHGRTGSFRVDIHEDPRNLYRHGRISRSPGHYYLTYADGTPFFWTADTAWNGALKSTDQEWEIYLSDRVKKGFNVIQFVTTQWRGGASDRNGRLAFEGSGRIRVDPVFFQRLDRKVDMINAAGLVAAPVLLWTLQFGPGRQLSPGYYLPVPEAILLAQYMVARYGGNHVVWILGGDGRYVDEYEQRWKNIGRGVFGGPHPGLVAQHPHGRSWIGTAYKEEDWLDIIGYQSSHSKRKATVDWINKGPVSKQWFRLPPKPIINLEPIYEQIHADVSERDVRNACYWSVFSAPPAGITYGANGIWPWLRKGEKILNHSDAPWTSTWQESLSLPGSTQVGFLSRFIQQFEWWNLVPVHSKLLISQPGDTSFSQFVSVLGSPDYRTLLIYAPSGLDIQLWNPLKLNYRLAWFNPVTNRISGPLQLKADPVLSISPPVDGDHVAVLRAD